MTETTIATTTPVMTPEQIDLIKKTVAKNCTDDEFKLFLHACRKTGLDPLMKQIYAVKRGNSMAIQTGIDGFRLIGERTGRYAPGREPSFKYDDDGKITEATSYVKKMTPDGTWHEVAATAHFEEYCPGGQFWQRMPHVMIAKVAEALALRRAFPMELSGIYSTEEMTQADAEQEAKEKFPRLRGVHAKTPAAEEGEPADVVDSGEAGGSEEGDGESGSGSVGRADRPDAQPMSDTQHKALRVAIRTLARMRSVTEEELTTVIKEWAAQALGSPSLKELTEQDFHKLMDYLAKAAVAARRTPKERRVRA